MHADGSELARGGHNKGRSTYYGHHETLVLNDPTSVDQTKLKDKNATCR